MHSLDRGNDNRILTFRAFAFLAGMNLRNTDTLAATIALELYLVRIIRYYTYAAALRAFNSLTGVFILNTEFLTTFFAGKTNHSKFLQFIRVIITGAALYLSNLTYITRNLYGFFKKMVTSFIRNLINWIIILKPPFNRLVYI